METKSRYEVIADLEKQKRELIKERDSLNDQLENRKKDVKNLERQKSDTNILLDRKIEDAKEELSLFEKTMEERKDTIKELIVSVDLSLERFNKLQKAKD